MDKIDCLEGGDEEICEFLKKLTINRMSKIDAQRYDEEFDPVPSHYPNFYHEYTEGFFYLPEKYDFFEEDSFGDLIAKQGKTGKQKYRKDRPEA